MPKLFISYRRKSWPFTHRLAEQLSARLDAEIFVDISGVDETDFEKSILRHLHESQAVILVISEHTFTDRIHRDDDWVRREIREALTRNIPLILVFVEGLLPPSGLPDDIRDVARMQGVNFYPDYFEPGVEKLAGFVVKIGAARFKTVLSSPFAPPAAASPSPDSLPVSKTIGGKATLDEAVQMLETEDFNKAIFLLEGLRDSGYSSRFVDLNQLLADAYAHRDAADRRRLAQIEYDEFAPLAKSRYTRNQALSAFAAWRETYPDLTDTLDTLNLRLESPPPRLQGANAVGGGVLLPPPFDWCPIPAGKVTIEYGEWKDRKYQVKSKKPFEVPAFSIAKYPVTNAQYQVFVDAPDGYADVRWWDYSKEAAGWRKSNTQPEDTAFAGDDLPRTNVSWYDSVAFCRWLSFKTGESITLPTEQQWQRTAQGDNGRKYAWGDEPPDKNRCNFNGNVGHPTPVTNYPQGVSPYQVMDMTGNVWEWCLTTWEGDDNKLDGDRTRVLRGGSWNADEDNLPVAVRDRNGPNLRNINVGVRIARS